MKSSSFSVFIRLAVSLLAIGMVVYFLRDKLFDAVRIIQTEVSWPWFSLIALAYFVSLVILAYRMWIIFGLKEIHIAFRDAFYLSFVGLFFNLFLPSAVGGDVAKAYYAYKHSGQKLASTTAVILDRMIGFVAIVFLALMAILCFHEEIDDPRVHRIVYAFLVLMLLGVAFFASKRFARIFQFLSVFVPSAKWRDRLLVFYHSIHSTRRHVGMILYVFVLSVVCQAVFFLVYYWIALGLGAHVSVWKFFIIVPVITILSMAPSVGGLGVREATSIYLFSKFMPAERALAVSVLVDVLIYGYSLIAGIVFGLRGGLKSKVIREMEELK